eukprot:746187-Hanusia_phi.AAC.2
MAGGMQTSAQVISLRPAPTELLQWVHRDTEMLSFGHLSNNNLNDKEKRLLSKVIMADGAHVVLTCCTDLQDAVRPFWPAVWKSALSWRGVEVTGIGGDARERKGEGGRLGHSEGSTGAERHLQGSKD